MERGMLERPQVVPHICASFLRRSPRPPVHGNFLNYALYIALGGALIFAIMAVGNFVEPEGSNQMQVWVTIGILTAIAVLMIMDRSQHPPDKTDDNPKE